MDKIAYLEPIKKDLHEWDYAKLCQEVWEQHDAINQIIDVVNRLVTDRDLK